MQTVWAQAVKAATWQSAKTRRSTVNQGLQCKSTPGVDAFLEKSKLSSTFDSLKIKNTQK